MVVCARGRGKDVVWAMARRKREGDERRRTRGPPLLWRGGDEVVPRPSSLSPLLLRNMGVHGSYKDVGSKYDEVVMCSSWTSFIPRGRRRR
ncbi:hypothetical protein QVD17_27370 [Tagetes erecta]|uniref:Uncharacterized protein n=1 Tax=Tagetes erecta TaxID=13708 RepID=A0AAD8KD07_TARER|nr:hypothetical protein QVD17_27364 [Tagetes erecta]KAK1418227.1 hypothetical protein QVD17_27370 [Tagetes erecta]